MPFSETLHARKIFKTLHGKIACCCSRHFGFTLNQGNLTKALRRKHFDTPQHLEIDHGN